MTAPRPARPFHRRAVFFYLLAIVGPTLVLLYLGFRSVQRQAQAVASLTAVNLRLSAERLATELEHRVEQSAQACLRDSEIAGLAADPETPFTPREARPLITALEKIEQQHPIADQLFLLRQGNVAYPLLVAREPRPIEEDLARE